MSLTPLFFTLSLLPITALAAPPQLSCTHIDRDTRQQLSITPNALGSHDVSLHTQTRGRPAQRTWLALRLTCTASDDKTWHCDGTQHNPLSPHAHSTLHTKELESGEELAKLENGKELEISITSPLLPKREELGGERYKKLASLAKHSATFHFASEQCTTQAQVPRKTYRHAPHLCQAHFSGAYYDPDQGDCVEEAASGCRNPFPYRSRTECLLSLKL